MHLRDSLLYPETDLRNALGDRRNARLFDLVVEDLRKETLRVLEGPLVGPQLKNAGLKGKKTDLESRVATLTSGQQKRVEVGAATSADAAEMLCLEKKNSLGSRDGSELRNLGCRGSADSERRTWIGDRSWHCHWRWSSHRRWPQRNSSVGL